MVYNIGLEKLETAIAFFYREIGPPSRTGEGEGAAGKGEAAGAGGAGKLAGDVTVLHARTHEELLLAAR